MYKKSSNKPSSAKRSNLSQFGLIDIPDLDDGDESLELSDDDIDFEAELAAISGGSKAKRPRKQVPVAPTDFDAMVAASLRDVPSDDEGSGDEDDSDLLNELHELTLDEEAPPRTIRPAPPPPTATDNSTVNLLQERISNYTIAEKNAKEKGETSRARRFGRGLKTLNDLLKQAKAGKVINNEDIPPAVSLGKPADAQTSEESAPIPPPRSTSIPSNPETPTTPEVPPRTPESYERSSPPEPKEPPPILPSDNQDIDPAKEEGLRLILKRKEEFKAAALSCKHSGDKALALEYMKVVKQFDAVVDAYKAGQEMDLGELPTPDMIAAAFKAQPGPSEENASAGGTAAPTGEAGGLVTASSVDEALRQRLAHFQEQESKAKEEGNSSKARRMGRIVKQYQDAVKLHAAGRPFAADDLPTPNGYAPLPTEEPSQGAASPRPTPTPSAPGGPSDSTSAAGSAPATPRPSSVRRIPSDKYQKQLALLHQRQKMFREAAYREKKKGDVQKARQYLRAAKGFDTMIQAATGGLVVDLSSLPLPPDVGAEVEEAFEVVSAEECTGDEPAICADDDDVLLRVAQQLTAQLKMCLTNRDHYKAMGNIAESNRFEQLALTVKQDLDVVKVAKRLNQDPPKFRYETRQFSIVECNTDLPDNVLELTIVRGIAYNVPNPSEVDTYVKFEFAYPPEAPVSDRTPLVKDTSSPRYDAVYSLPVARTNRACQRFFKRHAVKCEVYSRGGWFSRDTLLGTVTVKLAPLETQVTVHEAFPLMDGRKPAGGSLEVRLRLRSPLGAPHVTRSVHRWLLLDH